MTLNPIQISYIDLFFDTKSYSAEVNLVTSQKHFMTLDRFRFGQKKAQILETDFGKFQKSSNFPLP